MAHHEASTPPRVLMIGGDPGFLEELRAQEGIGPMRLDQAAGGVDALRRLRTAWYHVVVTSPRSPVGEDLALLDEMRLVCAGVKAIVLAPSATAEEVIATLRAQAFACPGFSPEDLPHAAVGHPPDEPLAHAEHRERLGLRPGGFGLLIARQVVDELLHSEKANEVLLIKHTA